MRIIELDITGMGAVRTTQKGKFTDERYHKYARYKQALVMLMKGVGIRECPERFEITFVIPFPISYTNKQCASMQGEPHRYKPDLDNLVKGFMDCWGKDDSGVHSIRANKFWGYNGKIILSIPE